MNPADETVSPASDNLTPPPHPVPGSGPDRPPCAPPPPPSLPTPEAVLRWVAAAGDGLWFPSAHAKSAGVPRDHLDEPLNELREAGLVRVADWVRGVGQGYVLTEDGTAVVNGVVVSTPEPAPPEPGPKSGLSGLDLRPPIVTPAFLIANLLWFFVGVVIAVRVGVSLSTFLWKGDSTVFARLGAVSAPDLLRGDWWRLFTCCFVHVGLPHLLMNMVGLGMVGPLAELLWGRKRVFVVYVVSGLAGSCVAMALAPLDPRGGAPVQLVGASGAIWGLMTSLLAWFLIFRHRLAPQLAAEWFRRLGLAFLLNAGLSFLPGVSWSAHLGGGVAGFVAAGLLNDREARGWRRLAATGLLLLLPVGCVGGLILTMKSGESWAAIRNPVRPAVTERVTRVTVVGPDTFRPVENEAVTMLLIRTPDRRPAATQAAVRQKVSALRTAAATAVTMVTDRRTGNGPEDERRDHIRAYAEAQVRSFDQLLAMLDAATIPDTAAWKAWGESRHEVDRLWAEVVRSGRDPAP